MSQVLKVGIVGAGNRVINLYGPILKILDAQYRVTGLTSQTFSHAEQASRLLGTQAYRSIDQLISQSTPDLLIVSVSHQANDKMALEAVATGLPCLLETPVSVQLEIADQLIAMSEKFGSKIEVAEQYYRRPMERIKQLLIQTGILGKVLSAYNDFMGHDYHGFSLIRSYLGFDVKPIRISGWHRSHENRGYYSWAQQKTKTNATEEWYHATVEFENNSLGHFDFSSFSYDSSLRWQRGTRFFAERGMSINNEITILSPDGKDATPIHMERRIHNVGGVETLASVVARVLDQRVEWTNPFRAYYMDDEMIATADCLRSLSEAILSDTQPEYGIKQARLDQQLTLAMRDSAQRGEPFTLA